MRDISLLFSGRFTALFSSQTHTYLGADAGLFSSRLTVHSQGRQWRVGRRIGDPKMVAVEDFSRLVSGIYAAAMTSQSWESVMRDVVGALDGAGGGLVFADGSSRWQVGACVAPEAAKSYAEHYA